MKHWEKKLYVKQPFPDNYVDASFLKELKKNINVPCHGYSSLVHASTPLVQHLSAISIFLSIFWGVKKGQIGATGLVFLANILTLIGYASWMWWIRDAKLKSDKSNYTQEGGKLQNSIKQSKQELKSAMIFLMVLLGVSPVLKTLTEDTSSDTIATLAMVFFLINYTFTDYSIPTEPLSAVKAVNPIALNAAIFASVLLASRLETRTHVFGLMSLAVNWFALFPLLRGAIRASLHPFVNVLVCLIMGGAATMLHFWVARLRTAVVLSACVAALHVFISFIAPLWFIRLQRYKNNIHGPWDEAKISQ